MVKNTVFFVCLSFLCALFGCASPSVKLSKEKISTLGRVGVLSVYEAKGPIPGLLDLAYLDKHLADLYKALGEADIASEMTERFAPRLKPLFGDAVRVSVDEPEVVNITESGGYRVIGKKFNHKYYRIEKLDYSSLGRRLGIDTLITLVTTDRTWLQNCGPAGSYSYQTILWLTTEAKMIRITSGDMLWQKTAKGLGERVAGNDVEYVKDATFPQIASIVTELIADLH